MCLFVSQILCYLWILILQYFSVNLAKWTTCWHKLLYLLLLGILIQWYKCQPGFLHIPVAAWWVNPLWLLFLHITLLRMGIIYELHLKGRNLSLSALLLDSRLDALVFTQLSYLHLLLSGHIVQDWHGVLLSLHLPHKLGHFLLDQLASGLGIMDKLHFAALPGDNSDKTKQKHVKILVIFF